MGTSEQCLHIVDDDDHRAETTRVTRTGDADAAAAAVHSPTVRIVTPTRTSFLLPSFTPDSFA